MEWKCPECGHTHRCNQTKTLNPTSNIKASSIKDNLEQEEEYGTLKLKYIKCGKTSCSCNNGKGHGPYWYLYYWENGKKKCKYLGKNKLSYLPRS